MQSDISKLIKQIQSTPHLELIDKISEQDLKQKKWLIETIQFYKDMYEIKPTSLTKSIIEDLYNELNELNRMINNLKKVKLGG